MLGKAIRSPSPNPTPSPISTILPPGCESKPQQYSLTLQLNSIQLIQISSKPVYIKFQMWGLSSQSLLQYKSALTFNIHTNAQLFYYYLRDTKITVIKLCDIRNNQQIGTGLLNWALYMRKIQISKSPFISDCFDIQLPVFNYKKKQIAEIKISVKWDTVTNNSNNSNNNKSVIGNQVSVRAIQQQQKYQPIQLMEKNSQNVKSKKNVMDLLSKQIDNRCRQKIVSIINQNDIINSEQEGKDNNQNQLQLESAYSKRKSKKKSQQIAAFLQKRDTGLQTTNNIRYPQSKYQLQKAKLRLQAQQFLTLTKNDYKKSPSYTNNSQQSSITVKLSDLITMKQNTVVEYIDLYIFNPKQKQSENGQKKQIRVFPIGKDNLFNINISLKENDTVQIQVGKGLAKGSIQAKTIKSKLQGKCFLYAKGGKFGSINYTVISLGQNMINDVKQTIPSKPNTKTIQNPQNISIKPQYSPSSTPSSSLYMLITINQISSTIVPKSPSDPSLQLFIKSYRFAQPLPSFSIISLVELGSIFAIQFRNNKGQTQVSIFVDQVKKIGKLQQFQGLSCAVLKNGRVYAQGDKGIWVDLEMMIGSMQQINYQLTRKAKYNRNNQVLTYQKQRSEHPINHQPKLQNVRGLINMDKKYKQEDEYQFRQSYYDESKKKLGSGSGSKHQKEQQFQIPLNRRKSRSKKLYTEMPPQRARLQTSQIVSQKSKDPEDINNNYAQDEPFLSQILSKFFHALQSTNLPQLAPGNLQQFINLLQHYLIGHQQQKQYIEFIVQMFVDDGGNVGGNVQQVEGAVMKGEVKIQYQEFIKCVRSYHNFIELWWRMRTDVISQVIKTQTQFQQKIVKYSQLGTITRQNIWRKVFPKITNSSLQLKFDKYLNLPASTPIPIHPFLQQLTSQTVPQSPTIGIIVQLSTLIKQTIQTILGQNGVLDTTTLSVGQDRLNIKIMCDFMTSIGIQLSYWESLMLIQELKAWYQVDAELNQGIVSAAVVQVWLKSVINRSRVSSKNSNKYQHQQQKLVVIESQAKQQQDNIKKQPAPSQIPKSPRPPGSQTPANPSLNLRQTAQNKSMVKSQLNQQQIENIANLLRDNDGFRMMTGYGQSSMNTRNYQDNNTGNQGESYNNNRNNMGKILDDQLLDQSNSQSQNRAQKNGKPQLSQNPISYQKHYLHIKIKSLKLKPQHSLKLFPTKLSINICPQSQHYFYCRSMDDIVDRQIVQQLNYRWDSKSKGVTVQFVKIDQNQEQSVNQFNKIYGVLVADQVNSLQQSVTKSKTIVLYGNKQIIGKITLQVTKSKQKPSIFVCQKPTQICIQVTPHDNHKQWQQFTIKVPSSPTPTLLVIKKCVQYSIQVSGTFYRDCIQIIVNGVGHCTVPLQELYFKREICGEFPVVADDGLYLGNIQVRLKNNNAIMDNISNNNNNEKNMNMMKKQINNSVQTGKQPAHNSNVKYLIILDSISSLYIPSSSVQFSPSNSHSNPHQLSILSPIYIKSAHSRNILYRSPYYIQHMHSYNTNFHSTDINQFTQQNYYIHESTNTNNSANTITFQMQYQGRNVASGIGVAKIIDNDNHNDNNHDQNYRDVTEHKWGRKLWYTMKYIGAPVHGGQLIMGISIRIIRVPTQYSKYNVSRIFKTLSSYKAPIQSCNIQNMLSSHKNLTTTQIRLLSILIPSQVKSDLTVMNCYIELSQTVKDKLITEFIFADVSRTGKIYSRVMKQILQTVIRKQNMESLMQVAGINIKDNHDDEDSYVQYMAVLNAISSSKFNLVNQRQNLAINAAMSVDKIFTEIKSKYSDKYANK